ncbi:MAG: TonB-dependent receptor [Phocaeicola dorei]|nr:TonB-dependent receptor [Phocaeicola dorei]
MQKSIQQNRIITGSVIDESGEALIGVSVLVKGTTLGTVTDLDGNFTLEVPTGAILVVSYVGYKTQEIKVGEQQKLAITVEADNKLLDEVVVVGYGVVKKSDLTGSVGSVKSETISAKGATSVVESLQGQVAGVNISQSSSRAGDGFNIQIRGKSSLNGGNPLYVIDEVVCENMDFLNPMDIEKVDILKDASSTAIYGSRATNGVVMITTKKGDKDIAKTTVSYDGYYGIKTKANMPDFMEGDDFMKFRFSRYLVSSMDASSGMTNWEMTDANFLNFWGNGSQIVKDMYLNKNYTDWVDIVTRNGSQQNHYISANGATEKINYRLGVGYQGEENVFKHNDYSRFNIKGAFDGKISKVFEAGLSVNMAYTVQDDFSTDGTYCPYENAFYFNPFVAPYDENGNIINNPGSKDAFGSTGQFTSTVSPLNDLEDENYTNQTRKFHVFGNVYLRTNIMDGLKFATTFSPNFYHGRQGKFNATGVNDRNPLGSNYYQVNGTNSAEVETTDRMDWTWDNQLDFNKTIDDHTFGAMGLFSIYRSDKEIYRLKGFGISDDMLSFHALDKASGDKEIASSYTASTLVSGALRLNYSYKGKYMATATARADGSSRFAEGNRWGWFPSVALAWRMSEESFLKGTHWLDNLKLRLSYGVTGNNNVDDYVTIATASGPSYVVLGGSEIQGYYPNGLVNTGLIWEKVKEFDLGLDFSVLSNRINLTADFYHRLSDGQIMDRIVPVETGETKATFNVGSVRNTGIELGMQFGIIRSKDFIWDLSVNYSRNWNKILELSNGKVDEIASNRFIGEPLNVLRDYIHTDVITDKGVTMHTKDGDIHYTLQELYAKYGSKYKWYEGQIAVNDWNNDGKITDEDKQIYGCTDPKWVGSLSSNMYYKGFDFSVMIYTKQGQWARSYFHDKYMKWSDRGNQHMAMDFYIPKGAPVIDHTTGDIVYATETHYGEYPYPNNSDTSAGGYFSDKGSAKGEGFQYQKTSFVKVKNICLGYTFPKKWITKAGLQHLRLYINVLNPFCFTDYDGFDPEWANAKLTDGGPASVTYQIGANIKF